MSSTIEGTPTDPAAVYLTDEVFLHRVSDLVGSGADEAVQLEDCYGLDGPWRICAPAGFAL